MAVTAQILNQRGKISNVLQSGQLRPGKIKDLQIRASRFGFEKLAEKGKSLPTEIASPSRGLLDYYNFSKEDEKKYPVITGILKELTPERIHPVK